MRIIAEFGVSGKGGGENIPDEISSGL